MKFTIIMTAFETFHFLPRALTCVLQQEHDDWELLVMLDGPAPAGRFAPRHLVDQLRRRAQRRIELHELPRATGCYGNVARYAGLALATGDYVCWINHDNLVTPQYLSTHAENARRVPGCLSVVDVDLWKQDRYHGCYPRALARSRIDLLCYAMPTAVARQIGAFGGAMAEVYAADWLVFDAARRLCPVEHARQVVGAHF